MKCSPEAWEVQGKNGEALTVNFEGGALTSDAGLLLLKEADTRLGLISRLAACFTDHRASGYVDFTVEELLAQRIYGLAAGYEDLNDHDQLRFDPLFLKLLRSDDKPFLAGKSTLQRLENGALEPTRYHRLLHKQERLAEVFLDVFLEHTPRRPDTCILDFDATDTPLHGDQEGRFYHGYYGNYCYLPLYVFCGQELLCATLREANQDGAAGALDELKRLVTRLRQHWPGVSILLRADSGFCREEIMAWCEANQVNYLLGLARNRRLEGLIAPAMEKSRRKFLHTHQAQRRFVSFKYQTRKSWSRARQVIGKAEYLEKGANPRFVVTSLPLKDTTPKDLYEKVYCARGDMENRIKEQKQDLAAGRTSAHLFRANQLRLWFSALAYVLVQAIRRLGLSGTELAQAQAGTIRLKLLKVGARILQVGEHLTCQLTSACPFRRLWGHVLERLRSA
ncbi:MAG TPA: IS1380 family transposase [Verrucomicrobiae bacterium]|nr:IS1380 family transposase [Verrucomicrobiae bacterium]